MEDCSALSGESTAVTPPPTPPAGGGSSACGSQPRPDSDAGGGFRENLLRDGSCVRDHARALKSQHMIATRFQPLLSFRIT